MIDFALTPVYKVGNVSTQQIKMNGQRIGSLKFRKETNDYVFSSYVLHGPSSQIILMDREDLKLTNIENYSLMNLLNEIKELYTGFKKRNDDKEEKLKEYLKSIEIKKHKLKNYYYEDFFYVMVNDCSTKETFTVKLTIEEFVKLNTVGNNYLILNATLEYNKKYSDIVNYEDRFTYNLDCITFEATNKVRWKNGNFFLEIQL